MLHHKGTACRWRMDLERRMEAQGGIDKGMVARAISLEAAGAHDAVADASALPAAGQTPDMIPERPTAFPQLAMPESATSDAPVRRLLT